MSELQERISQLEQELAETNRKLDELTDVVEAAKGRAANHLAAMEQSVATLAEGKEFAAGGVVGDRRKRKLDQARLDVIMEPIDRRTWLQKYLDLRA